MGKKKSPAQKAKRKERRRRRRRLSQQWNQEEQEQQQQQQHVTNLSDRSRQLSTNAARTDTVSVPPIPVSESLPTTKRSELPWSPTTNRTLSENDRTNHQHPTPQFALTTFHSSAVRQPETLSSSSNVTATAAAGSTTTNNNNNNNSSFLVSRKRTLATVDFVYPQQTTNGVVQPYRFGATVPCVDPVATNDHDDHPPPPPLPGSVTTKTTTAATTTTAVASNETLEEILYPSRFKRQEPAARESVSTMEPQQQQQQQQQQQPTLPTTTNRNETVATEKRLKAAAAALSSSSPPSSHQLSEKEDGHVTGLSVEDAVRDKVGCRPRANSTDGELKLPQRGLCDERRVLHAYRWNLPGDSNGSSATIGRLSSPKGFVNLGNTCFLNSTLQCLAYLPPFCQTLLSLPKVVVPERNGLKRKLPQGKRITLILQSLFHQAHRSDLTKNVLYPKAMVSAVPTLGTGGRRNGYQFRHGRQEDAHEFLVHLLDAMHDGELQEAGIDQHVSGWRDRLPIPRLDETTFIHRIFGGYFRSQVKCTNCGHRSNTYDPFLDLALEVSQASCRSLADAINEFTRKETLDSANRWKCSECKKKVCANKQLTVFRPPLSLCIQLKRFTYAGLGLGGFKSGYFSGFGGGAGRFGGGKKISKPIEFPANLKLPLSDGRSCGYSLTGLVIHVGGSASSGHYTAYVKQPAANSTDAAAWYHMDDSFVEAVSEKTVLKQRDAYVLFYCRQEVRLEFPTPPLRSSMTAEEATELGRQRARARAESLTELSSSHPVSTLAGANSGLQQVPKLPTMNGAVPSVQTARSSATSNVPEHAKSVKTGKIKDTKDSTSDNIKHPHEIKSTRNSESATFVGPLPRPSTSSSATPDEEHDNKSGSSSGDSGSSSSDNSSKRKVNSSKGEKSERKLSEHATLLPQNPGNFSPGSLERSALPTSHRPEHSQMPKMSAKSNSQESMRPQLDNTRRGDADDDKTSSSSSVCSSDYCASVEHLSDEDQAPSRPKEHSKELMMTTVKINAERLIMNKTDDHGKLEFPEKKKAQAEKGSTPAGGLSSMQSAGDPVNETTSSSSSASSSVSGDDQRKEQSNTNHASIKRTPPAKALEATEENGAPQTTGTGNRSDQNRNTKKQRTRIVLDRGAGREKVEVMVGPRHKVKAWKPKTVNGVKGSEFGLLGNRPVDQWDDDGDDGRGHDQQVARGGQERMKILETLEKDLNKRKRGMFLDRWDAMLDQGKVGRIAR